MATSTTPAEDDVAKARRALSEAEEATRTARIRWLAANSSEILDARKSLDQAKRAEDAARERLASAIAARDPHKH